MQIKETLCCQNQINKRLFSSFVIRTLRILASRRRRTLYREKEEMERSNSSVKNKGLVAFSALCGGGAVEDRD